MKLSSFKEGEECGQETTNGTRKQVKKVRNSSEFNKTKV